MRRVFMDYASTTPVDQDVVDAMVPYFTQNFGNASSLHAFGRDAAEALENGRQQVAQLLHARSQEILFTAGGTESDNMAVKGIAYLQKDKRGSRGPHIITSMIEHPAILQTCKHLEEQGFSVKYLPVDKYGLVNVEDVEQSISKDTFLISIMYANNEIGTIEPVEEIGRIAHDHDVLFHTDAVQAIGKIPIDVNKLHIDLLSISSHKIYGPKGVGALFLGEGIRLQPLVHGGGHERGLRSSTENIPGIVGLGKACEIARMKTEKDRTYLTRLRDKLIKGILQIDESYLNGHPTKRLANNGHFRFTGIEGEALLLGLDDRGIAAATGSACSSKKLEPSHVLTAIGIDHAKAHGSIRLTIGRGTTEDDVIYVIDVLPEVVDRLRKISPIWNR